MILALWARGLVRRRWGRLLGVGSAVALVVGLVGALGAFAVFARAEVARHAIAGVDVDWQIQLVAGTSSAVALHGLQPRPGVLASEVVGYADAMSLSSSTGGTVQTTGACKVIGLPGSYRSTFPAELRDLIGAHTGVLLTQQTASNLHAAPATTVVVQLRGRPPLSVRVDGIVDMPNADSFFQAVGVRAGAGPQAPPDNVLVLPLQRWQQIFGSDGSTQLHVRLARHLPADPGAAFARLSGQRKNYEVRMSGAAYVGDNLSARLDSARKDATYGQLLFAFLGLPGVLLGVAFAVFGAAVGTERRRAEQALLRLRGASSGLLVGVGAAESLLVWIVGAAVGTGAAWVAASSLWHVAPWWIAGSTTGFLVTMLAVLRPVVADARRMTVAAARRPIAATIGGHPWRTWLAWGAAAAAAAAVWFTTRETYQVVVAPEGVPSVSVSYVALAGPALAWIAGIWIVAAAAAALLGRKGALIRRVVRPFAGALSGIVASWMTRLRGVVVRAVVLLALAVAFAVSAAVFDASFSAQSRVDAELTNGADVTAFAPPGVPLQSFARRVSHTAGVSAVEPMQHRFAYVGNDLQDLYGIRPERIARATALSDALFAGGRASERLRALARRPDGVFVSEETVKDFVLRPGDLIRLRLLDARTHAYVPVAFHLLGVVREFPTAPTDSFLVANASYVAQQTHSTSAETLLIRASGRSPSAVATDVRRVIPGVSVRDIVEQRRITATGLVALDLSGLSALNLTFGVLGIVWTIGLLLSVGFVERRRQFAILRAVGARRRHVAAFLVTEAGSVVVGGSVAGAVLGGAVAWILVRVLRGVFDPPPVHPVVPWGYLGLLAAAAAAGLVVAIVFVLRHSAGLGSDALRELAL